MLIAICIFAALAAVVLAAGIYPHPAGRLLGPVDADLALFDAATHAVTANGDVVDLGENFSPAPVQPMAIQAHVTDLDEATGDETYVLTVYESADGVTYTAVPYTHAITATGVFRHVVGVTKRYVRATLTLAGTTPSITLSAWLAPA